MVKIVWIVFALLFLCMDLQAYTYSGYAYDQNGSRLSGVRVDFTTQYSFANVIASVDTDSSGYYRVDSIEDGWCVVSKDGYYTSYQTYTDVYLKRYAGEIDISGKWNGWFVSDSTGEHWYGTVLKLQQNGKKVKGKWKSKDTGVSGKIQGTLDGNVLTFKWYRILKW